jgi:hypothetical protein
MLYIGSKVIAARKGCGYATFYFIGLSCVKWPIYCTVDIGQDGWLTDGSGSNPSKYGTKAFGVTEVYQLADPHEAVFSETHINVAAFTVTHQLSAPLWLFFGCAAASTASTTTHPCGRIFSSTPVSTTIHVAAFSLAHLNQRLPVWLYFQQRICVNDYPCGRIFGGASVSQTIRVAVFSATYLYQRIPVWPYFRLRICITDYPWGRIFRNASVSSTISLAVLSGRRL